MMRPLVITRVFAICESICYVHFFD
jgi:hypothetical protein